MIEAFVGSIRNTEKANNIDVQLYLKKHESLVYKINKADAAKLTHKVQDKHFATIEEVTPNFSND